MTSLYSKELACWEARLDVAAVSEIPETMHSPPVAGHIHSEGISV